MKRSRCDKVLYEKSGAGKVERCLYTLYYAVAVGLKRLSHSGISLPHVEERARHRKTGASARTTRTRSRQGRPSEYSVDLGGHDEVVLMQSLDLLCLQRDCRIAPTEADIRMMAFSFR
jgi:hypothetical protein